MAEAHRPSNGVDPELPGGKPSFTVSEIFLGAHGLRAGWGLLLFGGLWEVVSACVYPFYAAVAGLPVGTFVFDRPRPLLVYEGHGGLLRCADDVGDGED